MPLVGHLEVSVADAGVEFTFSVENKGDDPVTLEFPSGQLTDVVVTEDAELVWQWRDERMFTQAMTSRTVEPGESLTTEMSWNVPTKGSYQATGSLEAMNATVEVQTAFEVR